MSSAYVGLFLAAFGAATLLPLQSEAVMVGLLLLRDHPPWALVTVASVGNVLGSVVNWLLGRALARGRAMTWLPMGAQRLAAARRGYHRYGRWSLLLSWMPVIGDPLTLMAGVLGEPLWRFVLVVSLAKLGRYLVIAAVTLGIVA
ncbi:YqaA family protein [uncultured Thiodictyon sp.]|jgi:membrane protein YqaA with SNARE-associated domain|uniref:YqaA family protein n=1 Tax=uncultured Thiodictyon sp. TaxID=1846217 RepID=UPI0025FDCB73|nr:YqaA family protein [uncultured Thiodictyon sp.]